ncbi:MAG TPA: hypothetical protein VFJ16_23595 [Longimicrobium sp.]|nr:hypothetical protein [Longimicrobium sp.]
MPGGAYPATVVEDLGDLGVNGRRLVMIQPSSEYAEGPFMWPAEELLVGDDEDETPGSGARKCLPDVHSNGIRVGSRVLYQTPVVSYEAEVIEDRGNVGWNGRHLYRIRSFDDYEDARITVEVPATALTVVE